MAKTVDDIFMEDIKHDEITEALMTTYPISYVDKIIEESESAVTEETNLFGVAKEPTHHDKLMEKLRNNEEVKYV